MTRRGWRVLANLVCAGHVPGSRAEPGPRARVSTAKIAWLGAACGLLKGLVTRGKLAAPKAESSHGNRHRFTRTNLVAPQRAGP